LPLRQMILPFIGRFPVNSQILAIKILSQLIWSTTLGVGVSTAFFPSLRWRKK